MPVGIVVGPGSRAVPRRVSFPHVSSGAHTTTALLKFARGSSPEHSAELFALVYDDLRQVAGRLLAGERTGHTLQPTALVHEAWLRLVDERALPAASVEDARRHFLALGTRVMRHILVDHARQHAALKRAGAWHRMTLDEGLAVLHCEASTVLDLEAALREIERMDARLAQIAELRVFGGLALVEVAATLGLGITVVKDDWKLAKALLSRRLAGQTGGLLADV